MSQFATPSNAELRPMSNSLGFAGFLCSLIGLVCTVGILCPIGFVLSLIGLRKEPRGFAIAGAIIGGIGSIGLVVMALLGFLATLLAMAGITAAVKFTAPYINTVADGASLYHQVELYKQAKGKLPATIDELEVDSSAKIDGWGNQYRYQLNPDGSFTILSDGPDSKKGTLDDISTTSGNAADHPSRKRNKGAV